MNMIDWYKKVVFENYTNFSGRARRSEYWYFILCNFLITLILYIPIIVSAGMSDSSEPTPIFYVFLVLLLIYDLAILIPSLAVAVRRLHDTGKSGWSYLAVFIPLVGPILLLVWFVTEGESNDNQWGPNPKAFDEVNQIGKE